MKMSPALSYHMGFHSVEELKEHVASGHPVAFMQYSMILAPNDSGVIGMIHTNERNIMQQIKDAASQKDTPFIQEGSVMYIHPASTTNYIENDRDLAQFCHLPYVDFQDAVFRMQIKRSHGPAVININQQRDNIMDKMDEIMDVLNELDTPEDKQEFLSKMIDPSLSQSQKILVLESTQEQLLEDMTIQE